MEYTIDLKEKIFNDWEVIEYHGKDNGNRSMWLCRCMSCKKEKAIDGYNLRSGRSKSCRKCSAAKVAAAVHWRHGQGRTSIYQRWLQMRNRCANPKNKSYKDYGGRGISVYQEWCDNFEAFRDYMGEPPTPMHTVDRINNDGNYEPGNVKWSTQAEQMANTRRSKKYRNPQA